MKGDKAKRAKPAWRRGRAWWRSRRLRVEWLLVRLPLALLAVGLVAFFAFHEKPGPPQRSAAVTAALKADSAKVSTTRIVSLAASPRLAAPSPRLVERKLGFGVEPPRLASPPAALAPAPLPTPPAAPVLRPAVLPVLPRPPPTAARAGGTLAVIIDDVGLSGETTRAAIALPAPLTLAFLPYGNEVGPLAAAAAARGHEVFLHLSMEPMGGEDAGPNAILTGLDPLELARRLAWAFDRVPGAVGLNNHMGSRATSDAATMMPVLREARRRGLAFVDSRTTPLSVADGMAGELGLPHATRDVFLDDDPASAAVMAQLARAGQLAARPQGALAIGHPHPTTLAALRAWLPEAQRRGIRLVSARELIAWQEGCTGPSLPVATRGEGC